MWLHVSTIIRSPSGHSCTRKQNYNCKTFSGLELDLIHLCNVCRWDLKFELKSFKVEFHVKFVRVISSYAHEERHLFVVQTCDDTRPYLVVS